MKLNTPPKPRICRRAMGVILVRFQAGIEDLRDAGMALQEAGDVEGAGVLLADAQFERLHAAQQQISRHRVEARAVDLAEMEDRRDQFARAADHAAERVGMAAQEFGCAVDHQVGSQAQRILVDGRGEGVVHDDDGPAARPACASRARSTT